MKKIITKRLILREWMDSDVDPFTQINQDPKVLEFLPAACTKKEVENWIHEIKQHFAIHGFGLWAATLKNSGELIGFVGLNVPAFDAHFTPCVEIGWRLGSAYWGQGYATEAAKAVLKLAFDEIGLNEVVSFTVPENIRSIKVMEKIDMIRDLRGDFKHPKLPTDHRLSLHVLYRIKRP